MNGALGQRMIVGGALCVIGMTVLLDDMLGNLASTPADLDHMVFMHTGLPGWFGRWGYVAAWIWLPTALWRVAKAKRRGGELRSIDRVLPTVVATQIVAVQCLLRLTLLRYGYPLI